jgi:hypothetical protein
MCISELCLHLHLTRLFRSKSLKLCEKLIGVYKTGRMLKRGIGSFTNPEETAIWIYIVFCLLLWFQTAGSEILFNGRRAFIHRYALCFCKFLTAFLSGCKSTDFSLMCLLCLHFFYPSLLPPRCKMFQTFISTLVEALSGTMSCGYDFSLILWFPAVTNSSSLRSMFSSRKFHTSCRLLLTVSAV